MRWMSPVAAAATIIGVGVLGFTPTEVGLSNGVGNLTCRPLLAPIDGASLVGDTRGEQSELVERWLVDVGYLDENENASTELMTRVDASLEGLCGQARQSRIAWISLLAVFGSGLTILVRGRGARSHADSEASLDERSAS